MTTKLEDFLTQKGLSGSRLANFDSTSLKHIAMLTPTTVCVAALPRATDPVRLLGETDKHATLLFFGETSTLPDDAKNVLTETIQNVSLLFTPFTERIIEIARLGSDVPPALVAMLTNDNLGKIREALLINPRLGDYLQNATQHPKYIPHVTLDFPDYQGEADIRKLAADLFRVQFDRLSLWWGEEQIEFSLDMADATLAQMDKLEAHLAHFGRKGMKWGVRRSDAQLSNDHSNTSSDAIRAHETLTAIRSAGSIKAVSDADLQHLTNRLNLEKRFSEIDPGVFDKGHAKLQKALKVGQTANDVLKFANSPAGNLMASALGLSKHGKHAAPIPGSKAAIAQKAARKAAKAKKKAQS